MHSISMQVLRWRAAAGLLLLAAAAAALTVTAATLAGQRRALPGRPALPAPAGPDSPAGPRPERQLVVDTDAGADDAFAILALLRGEADALRRREGGRGGAVPRVVAITTVSGNTGVNNVTKNVFATLDCAGRLDVPVYAGATEALLPPRPSPSFYFGNDGFGDFQPAGPPLGEAKAEHAAVALVRLAKERPGELVLVCLGPLTNVALATRLDPCFLDNLQAVYILGGAAYGKYPARWRGNGNAAPGVEFNVQQDPEATLVVLDAIPKGKPAFLMPWETVLDAALPMVWRRGVLGRLSSRSMTFLNKAESVSLAATQDSWTCADGLLAAAILDTSVAPSGKAVRVSVAVGGGPGRGVSLVDHSNTTGLAANAVLLGPGNKFAFQIMLTDLFAS